MTVMGRSAAIPLQRDFVNNIVLPHFYLFAPAVYGLEVLTAVSLILGIFVRFWGLIGALQILNLWLGLYNAEGEWPWTYFFLLVIQLIFALHHYGRSLGLDALILARCKGPRSLMGILAPEATYRPNFSVYKGPRSPTNVASNSDTVACTAIASSNKVK